VAPKLIELSETVLYGDVWERPGLSKRDRSLITVAALAAMGRNLPATSRNQPALDSASHPA
jgi:4-carboxymuconolactone decarboxylase